LIYIVLWSRLKPSKVLLTEIMLLHRAFILFVSFGNH